MVGRGLKIEVRPLDDSQQDEVSIPTHPEGQVQLLTTTPQTTSPGPFQSPPTPKGRCNDSGDCATLHLQQVSIPTHPEGQVQPRPFQPCGKGCHILYLFQSPPTPKGRCNAAR